MPPLPMRTVPLLMVKPPALVTEPVNRVSELLLLRSCPAPEMSLATMLVWPLPVAKSRLAPLLIVTAPAAKRPLLLSDKVPPWRSVAPS